MSGNGIKFEYTRALVRARKAWGKRDRNGNYITVALAVHNYTSGDGGLAFGSAVRISEDTGIPARTVKRALAFLQDEGLLHRDERGGRNGDGSTRASVYSLRIPAKWSDSETESQGAMNVAQRDESQGATGEPQRATNESQRAIDEISKGHERGTPSDPSIKPESIDPKKSDPQPDSVDCHYCDISSCGVCGLHFHDFPHKWHPPIEAEAPRISPSPAPTMGSDEKRCTACGNPVEPPSAFFCARHMATFGSRKMEKASG